jgi:hypothetical protein
MKEETNSDIRRLYHANFQIYIKLAAHRGSFIQPDSLPNQSRE